MNKLMFTTTDQAMDRCRKENMQPTRHCNGLGENEYWIDLSKDPYAPMECYYGDDQFLGWANAYFSRLDAGVYDETPEEEEEG